MKHWSDFLEEAGEYSAARRALKQKTQTGKGAVGIFGCIDAAKGHIVHSLGQGYDFRLLITADEQKARQYCEDLRNFEQDVWYYPARDLLFFNADIQGNEITAQRMMVISRILEFGKGTIVTTIDGCMDALVPLDQIRKNTLEIASGDVLNLEQLKKQLVYMGYERCGRVSSPGQFSVRGGIIDIFILTEDNPIRIEMWDDEVDTLRYFDRESQRSLDEGAESIRIYPASEVVLDEGSVYAGLHRIEEECASCEKALRKQMRTEEASRLRKMADSLAEDMKEGMITSAVNGFMKYFFDDTVSFLEYFPENTCIFLDEPVRLQEKLSAILKEFQESMRMRLEKGYILPGQADSLLSEKEVVWHLEKHYLAVMGGLEQKDSLVATDFHTTIMSRNVNSYQNRVPELTADLAKWCREQYRIVLVSASRTRAKRLAENLRNDYMLAADYTEEEGAYPAPGRILVTTGTLLQGFEYPLLRAVVITENDMFGMRKKKRRKKHSYSGQAISSFQELKPGDYVVHESHGLGVYRGVQKMESKGITRDYLKIEYGDGGNLYVPITQFDLVQKYASSDADKTPKLNRLGGKEWKQTHAKVKGAVQQIAKELVTLYAARQSKKGYQFSEDTVWQAEFEEMFPYTETEDQLEAIQSVKNDMESPKIMDRLVCGDVGFGKTEVAIRAAFKAVQDGKQVVYLCPTTILAQQHYNTFVQRMSKYPVRIDLLCRFKTPAQQKKTTQDLKTGLVDIVIGTHRVLSKDVVYKDLGLLIIDEEQRFGVNHKEKIKQLKNTVDVLTLTATPIPRTLHMSLIGIRDLSMLEEPPLDRTPIQTYVMEHDEELIREAINRELSRNGQVYYVYNRVGNIAAVAARLQEMLPDAVVEFAHGQMSERQLERIMLDFVNGEIDVLVSTTIIETGLDISNVNTIIIQDADRFGLSQLYQLRGRVGRTNRTSYAFMTYTPGKILREVAEKRLEAIRQFTDLGSGVKIAMRDLEIRGAGTLLGASQSGHLEAVGYDLYCKMLNVAIKNLKEDKVEDLLQTFDTQLDISLNAYIPPSYISSENQKLEMYKKIASIENKNDYMDMQDELIDRFGEMPTAVENLLMVAFMKAKAHENYIVELLAKPEKITIKMLAKAPVQSDKVLPFMQAYGGRLRFVNGETPGFSYQEKKGALMTPQEQIIVINELLDRMKKELFV
ncbi:MAG: transcription-repair coupling factor [Lachnospiraceae bacterium]|nr:transcription-repair coupling factor [Lachnospiraceae bacterium]